MNCDGGDNTVCAVRREKHEAAVCGIDEEADGGASREVRKMVSPQMPSQQEVEAHELTHFHSAIGVATACVGEARTYLTRRVQSRGRRS